jgi:hypothetical protein
MNNRPLLMLLTVIVCCGAANAAPPDDAVEGAAVTTLAQTYTFGVAEMAPGSCLVTLTKAPVREVDERTARPVKLNAACGKFASLAGVTHWVPTGGASVALFGGDPLREIADFSPVQDGSGVYLRGGFAGDARIYELRLADE